MIERLQKNVVLSSIALFWFLFIPSLVVAALANLFHPNVIAGSALTAFTIAGLYLVVKDQHAYAAAASKVTALALMVSLFVVSALPAAAQETTAVPLDIPTDVIFSETNSWLVTFAPIAAIGIGITVALAVLGYLGKMIVSAFKR